MRPFLLFLLATPAALFAQTPTNLWVVDLTWAGDRLTVGAPRKLTHDEGSNSQPSFTPDGNAVVFSAIRDTLGGRSDIYRIDVATRRETQVTRTPENENSPTALASGEYVAVRWVPATLFKEYGPWVYDAAGVPSRGVLRGPDTTGYYTPLPNGDYALTRPKSRTFTIGLFDAATGAIVDVDSGVPALPAQRIPGASALSYVRVDSAAARHRLMRVDLATRRVTSLGPTLVGRTAHTWVAGHNTVLMAKGDALYARRITSTPTRDTAWRRVATFASPELRHASAYVVNPQGTRLVLVSPARPALAVLMRDSLEAGRSAGEVVALVTQMQSAGQLSGYDVSEGAIAGLVDARLLRAQPTGAVALQSLATTLFPRSHRALARLGDAQRAAGDSASAAASYRRAVELNPQTTAADSAALADVRRKLGGQP